MKPPEKEKQKFGVFQPYRFWRKTETFNNTAKRGRIMSKSGQAFVAATQGHQFTLYAVMKAMGIPLSEEQAKFQAYLERTYPAVVEKRCARCGAIRTDDIDSDICGSCADDLRME